MNFQSFTVLNRVLTFTFIGKLLLAFCFLPLVTEASEDNSFHICYFSLNNEKEFKEMRRFTRKLNKHSTYSITISEYMTEGGRPEESFKEMVESGVKCDGLVISGHHTGSFGGKRARGSLSIGFLERLSCKEEYAEWFGQIKALWLQGCRTLGTGEIVLDEEEVSADYHTNRVGAVLDADHLEQSFAELNIEFSSTLDQDNPLSSRYLRIFPMANVFGWTKTAPGEVAGSQYSIPFHIAHIAKRLDKEDRFPSEGPLGRSWTEESSNKYMESLVSVLNGEEQYSEMCVEAWKSHGKVHNQSTEYGFLNPDLQAHKALVRTDNEILKQARIYDCLLKNSEGEKLLEVLDLILEGSVFIRYTYNALLYRLQVLESGRDWDYRDYREDDDERRDDDYERRARARRDRMEEEREERKNTYLQIINKLKNSQEMSVFLSKKLNSKRLGVLRKIEYYTLYEKIYGRQEQIRAVILKGATEIFQKVSSRSRNERDYKETLFQSLSKHGYLDSEQSLTLLKQVMRDTNGRLRRYGAREMAKFSEEALSFFQMAIEDPSPYMRSSAVLLASYIVRKNRKSISIVKKIIDRGLEDSEVVRVSLAETIPFFMLRGADKRWGISTFKKLAFVPSKKVRLAVADQLPLVAEVLYESEFLPIIQHLVDKGDDDVREIIAFDILDIVEKVDGEAIVPIIQQLAGDKNIDIRESIADDFEDIVEEVGVGEMLSVIQQLIVDEDEYIQRDMVYTLEVLYDGLKDEELEDILLFFRQLLVDPPSSDVFDDVIDIIEDIDDPVFLPLLKDVLEEGDLSRSERVNIQGLIEDLER